MSILAQVQADAVVALRSGDRRRAQALRLVVSELQKASKEAAGGSVEPADELAVLRRERKRRIEAAEAYADAGRDDLAGSERGEAELIEAYLPAELSDAELEALVGDALAESGASSPKEMGRVMSMVMGRVDGRADGRRVSALVKEKLVASPDGAA
ncbi:MAG: GatB/YqeY domain-containing protein [Actinomycetota bacterium]|nr:GatB/YqeY domain-containing protein [Actinomycetota bacterium]